MTDTATTQAAVYVSWTTFKNSLTGLAQGLPNRIDKSAFPGLSGGVQAQLMAGLKFLGLIDNDGVPHPSLEALAVTDETDQKAKLASVLRDRYKAIFALGIDKMTPAQLDDAMTDSYGVTGDTREKAVRFFLSAVQHADIPVSRLLQAKTNGNGSAGRKKRSTSKPRAIGDADAGRASTPPGEEVNSGKSLTINMRSGGTLTIAASVDFFTLGREDRDFVFKLIDELNNYAKDGEGGEAAK